MPLPLARGRYAAAVLVLSLIGSPALAQTQVLDIDAFNGTWEPGQITPTGEYIYTVNDGVNPATMFVLDWQSGVTRQLDTTGFNAGFFLLFDVFDSRFIVSNRAIDGPQKVYSVDLDGVDPTIPLVPDPTRASNGRLAPMGDQVWITQPGDGLDNDPANRDLFYTGSIVDGVLTEISGGVPQTLEITNVRWANDGDTLFVGMGPTFGPDAGATSVAYLATPGVVGLTQVLPSAATNVRYRFLGSDSTGDHVIINQDFEGTFGDGIYYSVPVANPSAATIISARADNTDISFDNEVFDLERDLLMFTSQEPQFNPIGSPRVFSLMTVPLDGSTTPQVVGNLPERAEPIIITPAPAGGQWDYVVTAERAFSFDGEAIFAFDRNSSDVIEIAPPVEDGFNARRFRFNGDGSSVFFTDNRTAGNDLYIGTPGDAEPVQTLFDVPDEDRLIEILLTPNEDFVIVSLVPAAANTETFADRYLAVPVDGGEPITLEDVTPFGAIAQLGSQSPGGIEIVGDELVYLRGTDFDEIGLFVLDLPTSAIEGDFNADGRVDNADLSLLLGAWGDASVPPEWTSGFNGPLVDNDELSALLGGWGIGTGDAVPEPSSSMIVLGAPLAAARQRRRQA